jgi:hypothetical protein
VSVITNTLAGFPLVNQLVDPPADRWPDNNESWNCVPASISAGVSWLLGKVYYGNQLKDAVYGNAYTGGQAPASYAGYLAGLGIELAPYDNTYGPALVAAIYSSLKAGHPTLVTMPSQWGIPYADPVHPSGSTHVGIACGWGNGWIRVMNPWGGFWQDGDNAYWAARLCFGQVWSMSRNGGSMAGVPAGWHDNGEALTAPNGVPVTQGFYAWVKSHDWDSNNYPLAPAYSTASVEPGNASIGAGTRQDFRLGSLGWTEKMNVYTIWVGQDVRALMAALAAANAEIAQLKSAPKPDYTAELHAVELAVAAMHLKLGANGEIHV